MKKLNFRKCCGNKPSIPLCRCNKWIFIRYGMWETIWVSKRPHCHWSKKIGWQSKWFVSPNKKVFIHLDRSSSLPLVPISGAFHKREAQACYCAIKGTDSKMSFLVFTDVFSENLEQFDSHWNQKQVVYKCRVIHIKSESESFQKCVENQNQKPIIMVSCVLSSRFCFLGLRKNLEMLTSYVFSPLQGRFTWF